MSLTIAAELAQIPAHHLNIMGYVDESAVNGPGCRAVVWVQGCSRECRGCFNQASWPFKINQLITVESLAAKILANPRNSGLMGLRQKTNREKPQLQSPLGIYFEKPKIAETKIYQGKS